MDSTELEIRAAVDVHEVTERRLKATHGWFWEPRDACQVDFVPYTDVPYWQVQQDRGDDPAEEDATTGTLRVAPSHEKGDVSLIIFIEKWGLKDAMSYTDPRVVVSVRDDRGQCMEAVQVRVGG